MDHSGVLLPDAKTRHDLRNQLGIILGFSDILLADSDVSDPRRRDIEDIRQAAVNALDLLERLSSEAPGPV